MKTLPFLEKLKSLDLENVAVKLMSCNNGCGWTDRQTKKAIARYRMFLYLIFLFPTISLSPTKEIDEVWHAHILVDTQRYMEDCMNLYGYILHHRINNYESNQNQQKIFEQTQQLFEKTFGFGTFGDANLQIAACVDLKVQKSQINSVQLNSIT